MPIMTSMMTPARPTIPPAQRRGFTLIEVMIVVVIVAVLAAIALPSFMAQIRASRRAEAVAQLSLIQQAQERWRANQPAYANVLMTANPLDCDTEPERITNSCLGIAAVAGARYVYTMGPVSATGYTLTATPQGNQNLDSASGVSCNPLTVTLAGGTLTNAPAACFRQ